MRMRINYVVIKNFRKHLDYQCDFVNGTNEFMGLNGVGKSTILDAITWCLFGKNFNEEKKFNIFPIINGEERRELNPFVEVEVENDDKKFIIQREFYKTDGMTNGSTILKIDNVKFSGKEFETYLKEKIGIELEEFKTLCKTNYAINFKEKDLRALVYDVFNVNDKDLLEHETNVGKFDNIKSKIEEIGIEKTKEFLLSQKKDLKSSSNKNKILMTDLETKLTLKRQELDEDKIKKDLERRNQIKELMESTQEKINEEEKKEKEIQRVIKEIEKNETHILSLKEKQKDMLKQKENIEMQLSMAMNLENVRNSKLKELEFDFNQKTKENEYTYKKMKELESEIVSCKNKFEEYKNKEIQIDDDKCPFCKQELPKEMLENSFEAKKQEKSKELKKIQEEINERISIYNESKDKFISNKKYCEEISNQIEKTKSMSDDDLKQFVDVENELVKEMKKQSDNISNNLDKIKKEGNESLEKHKLLKEKLNKLPKPIKVSNKENLMLELENINNRLTEFKMYQNEVKEYNKYKELYLKDEENKIELEKMEKEYDEYLKYKDILISKNVKKYFPSIEFKTISKTNDGKENKCFIVTMNGKEYKDLSTGEKLHASICLVLGLQKMRNKKFPILIDNFESISRLEIEDTQVICCSAMKEPPKEILKRNENGELEKVENENYDKFMKMYSELQLKKY